MAKLSLKIKPTRNLNKKLNQIGEIVTSKMKLMMEGYVGHSTPLTDSIKYEILGDRVRIYTEGDIPTFLEEGTKPHIIRPKNKKALAFRSLGPGTPNGNNDTWVVKEVKHPGTDPRPFFSQGFFLSQEEIQKVFRNK